MIISEPPTACVGLQREWDIRRPIQETPGVIADLADCALIARDGQGFFPSIALPSWLELPGVGSTRAQRGHNPEGSSGPDDEINPSGLPWYLPFVRRTGSLPI